MRLVRRTRTIYFLLLLLGACTPNYTPLPASSDSTLFIFNLSRSSWMAFSPDLQVQRELPLQLPCPLVGAYPAPNQPQLALELECASGPLVQIVNTDTGEIRTPVNDVDSHFLAWDYKGNIHLRVDMLGNAHLIRVTSGGETQSLDLPVQTYDMDFSPDGKSLVYSFTRGLGLGSELWISNASGRRSRQLITEKNSIITFARWSPDGRQIAFIKMPDSQTPFPLGELWVMEADGDDPRKLAPADAGHGYPAAWSPDSSRIAFVGRDNPQDAAADQFAGSLVSNIYLVDISNGLVTQVTHFEETLVEAPAWSADGHFLAISVVTLNDTIIVWIANPASNEVMPIESTGAACCPVWMRK